jgi:mRNA interferase ChpB
MERGEIYLITLETQAGPEPRSVLVVSPARVNLITAVPVVVPILPGEAFRRTAGFAVSLLNAGTQTLGVVHCDQPQAVDITLRGGRLVERAPAAVVDEVLARLTPIFI